MKLRWILPMLMVTAISMTGCGSRQDMTVQQEEMPVVPAETTFVLKTDTGSAGETGSSVVTVTQNAASVQTNKGNTTRTETGTAQTTAANSTNSTNSSASGNSDGRRTANTLYGPGTANFVFDGTNWTIKSNDFQ